MVLWGGEVGPGEAYLYHYTTAETLARILLNGTLRMGPYSATRDPRENQAWIPTLTAGPSSLEHDPISIWGQLDKALRQRAKLLCLTMDLTAAEPAWANTARGWGRARMWEQYASQHRGAVLVLDSSRLMAAATEACAERPLYANQVEYTTGPWGRQLAGNIVIDDIVRDTAETVADRLIAERHREIFFTKDADWMGEAEYRLVTIDDGEAIYLNAREALVGIALGMDYPDYERAVVRHRLELVGCQGVHITSMRWLNGYPSPEPFLG